MSQAILVVALRNILEKLPVFPLQFHAIKTIIPTTTCVYSTVIVVPIIESGMG
jgi:hypothetical protein